MQRQANLVVGQTSKQAKLYMMPTKRSQVRAKPPRGATLIIEERDGAGLWYLGTYMSTTGQGIAGWIQAKNVQNITYQGNRVNPLDIQITEYETLSRDDLRHVLKHSRSQTGSIWSLIILGLLAGGMGLLALDIENDAAFMYLGMGIFFLFWGILLAIFKGGQSRRIDQENARLKSLRKSRRADYEKRNLSDVQAHAMKASINIGQTLAQGTINEYFEDR